MDIEKAAQELFEKYHKSVVMVLRISEKPKENLSSTAPEAQEKKKKKKKKKKNEKDNLSSTAPEALEKKKKKQQERSPKFGGTGFIIGGRRTSYLVMTCNHVTRADPKYKYRVRLPGEDTTVYEAKLLHICADSDVAMFHVIHVTIECRPLQFADSYGLACETLVFLLGYVVPNNKEGRSTLYPAISPLILSTPHQQTGPGYFNDIVCTGAVKNGVSGSPVIFRDYVIGMLYQCNLGCQDSFVRTSELINKVLKGWLELSPDDNFDTKTLIDMFCDRLQM